jgi:hypothetical protein
MTFKLAAVLLFLACLSSCATAPGTRHASRPNVIRNGADTAWIPAPGYSWVYPDNERDLSVRWEPGKAYTHPVKRFRVIAADTERDWSPAPGYTWVTDSDGRPIPGKLEVRWKPGVRYWFLGRVEWPNIHAGDAESVWQADPGYEWVHPLDREDLAVVSIAERKAAQQQENEMEEHWAKYLKDIQTQNAYPNWSGPPHDLYLRNRKR